MFAFAPTFQLPISMATKFYLTQSLRYPVPSINGQFLEFTPVCEVPQTNSVWGVYTTDDKAVQDEIAKFKHLTEIDENDYEIYIKQSKSMKSYGTVIHFQSTGMATDFTGGKPAITVDTPPAKQEATKPAVLESAEEILATKVTGKK